MQQAAVDVKALIANLDSEDRRTKFAASKALRELSERSPERLYPYFDVLVNLLRHQNNILKWNAIRTLGHLAFADTEGKLDGLLGAYLSPIAGPALITAANTVQGGALIALAKPHLANRIAREMMRVEKGKYATPECRNIMIGHALKALAQFVGSTRQAKAAQSFAARHVNNPRRSTANQAHRFVASFAQHPR